MITGVFMMMEVEEVMVIKDDLVTLTVVFLISLPMMMMVAVMVMTYC